jgi:hypothetical protein
MSTITLDAAAAEILKNCTRSAELRDPAGNVVGYFEPAPRIYPPGELPEFDEAELDRREAQWDGIPSAEVRRRLEQLR